MSIEGQGHFFTIFFPGLYVLCFTRPRYQVSIYRTIGTLVYGELTPKYLTIISNYASHMFCHTEQTTSNTKTF